MPAKKQKNAYYWFMQDLLRDFQAQGRAVGSMKEVADLAHPRWNAMSEKDKERYERKAQDYKKTVAKSDNVGNIIHQRVDPIQEYEMQRRKEAEITRSKWPCDLAGVAALKFYFIDFQILCKTKPIEQGEPAQYLPVEMAVLEYSLRDGITRTFHQFLKPPPIPMGCRYECKNNSETMHMIPLEGHPDCTDNYLGLYIQLKNFINPSGRLLEYPPFYVPMQHFECARYCLDWIHGMAATGHANEMQHVYELESLIIELTAHATQVNISKQHADELLSSNTYDYEIGTKCEFHDKNECCYCSLAIAKRYAFCISEFLCDKYGINVTPSHLPSHKPSSMVRVVYPPDKPVEQPAASLRYSTAALYTTRREPITQSQAQRFQQKSIPAVPQPQMSGPCPSWSVLEQQQRPGLPSSAPCPVWAVPQQQRPGLLPSASSPVWRAAPLQQQRPGLPSSAPPPVRSQQSLPGNFAVPAIQPPPAGTLPMPPWCTLPDSLPDYRSNPAAYSQVWPSLRGPTVDTIAMDAEALCLSERQPPLQSGRPPLQSGRPPPGFSAQPGLDSVLQPQAFEWNSRTASGDDGMRGNGAQRPMVGRGRGLSLDVID